MNRDRKAAVVEVECRLTLAYRLALSDGTEVDRATVDEPFVYIVGDGALLPNLESLLIGLVVGDREQFLIAAEEGFGVPDPDQVHAVDRSEFEDPEALEPGMVLSFEAPSGDEVAATIIEVGETQVEVDFNHPLAGRDLQFEVEILAIEGADCGD